MQLKAQIALNTWILVWQSRALVGGSDITDIGVNCWTALYAQALCLINRLSRKTLSKHESVNLVASLDT